MRRILEVLLYWLLLPLLILIFPIILVLAFLWNRLWRHQWFITWWVRIRYLCWVHANEGGIISDVKTEKKIDLIRSELEAKIEAEIEARTYVQHRNENGELEMLVNDEYAERGLGFCHTYWQIQKEILKKDYGIKWRTPKELNPHCQFD